MSNGINQPVEPMPAYAAASSYPSVRDILAKADFIRVYRTYADKYELPPETHDFVALSLLAAILNRKVAIQYGDLKTTLDLWVLLLSPSGTGRDTALVPAREILRQAEVDILRSQDFGSREAAYQQISEKPCGLYLWPEFSVTMKKFSDGRFSGLREWFTARYDCQDVPADIGYRTRPNKSSSDTPPIHFERAPRLNILATSARDWFTNNLEIEDTLLGFLPRWTIVDLPDSDRSIPEPEKRNPKPERFLAEFLREAANLSGTPDFSQVKAQYAQWYNQTKPQMRGSLETPFFGRLRAQVLKFAVLAFG